MVMLDAPEYVAFRALCDEAGVSMSAKAREIIRSAIHVYAQSAAADESAASAESAQESHK